MIKYEKSIALNEHFFHIIVSMHQTAIHIFFLSLLNQANLFFPGCYVQLAFFYHSFSDLVVSAAVACAFNFSLGFFFVLFFLYCFFVLLLVQAANLIWYAPHDDKNTVFAVVETFVLLVSLSPFTCVWGVFFFSDRLPHRLTTFTTLFMFTLSSSSSIWSRKKKKSEIYTENRRVQQWEKKLHER